MACNGGHSGDRYTVNVTDPATPLRERYLTRGELAQYLGVSEKTVARWGGAGMPCERWGRRLVRYRLDRVEAWLSTEGAAGGDRQAR